MSSSPKLAPDTRRKVCWAHVERASIAKSGSTGQLSCSWVRTRRWPWRKVWWCLGSIIFQTNQRNVPSMVELSIQEEVLGVEPRLSKMEQWGSRKEKAQIHVWELNTQICEHMVSIFVKSIKATDLDLWMRESQLQIPFPQCLEVFILHEKWAIGFIVELHAKLL